MLLRTAFKPLSVDFNFQALRGYSSFVSAPGAFYFVIASDFVGPDAVDSRVDLCQASVSCNG